MRPPMGHFNNPGRGTKILHLGEKVGGRVVGWPNSRMSIDTAEELGGGRGLTWTDMHLTEVAYWRDRAKALSLLPAVPKRPGTSIFMESTPNGQNWFYEFVMRAAKGLSEFEVVFVGWWEDPDCVRGFMSAEKREEFIADIGNPNGPAGVIAEDEPWLVEEFGCTPEQLHFRRTAIVDECDGKVELFRQEYPATLEEGFLGSGRQVFSVVFTARAIREAESVSKRAPEDGGPQRGMFVGEDPVTRKLSDGEVQVPSKVLWVPEAELTERVEWWPGSFWGAKDPLWTIWQPKPKFETAEEWRQAHDRGEVDLGEMESGMAAAVRGPGQFIVAGDAADNVYNDVPSQRDEHAFNTLIGIDHWTGEQVAQYRARIDHDIIARHAYLCGLFLNTAWLSIERTGGYGNVILDLLVRRYYYRRVFTEKAYDDKKQRETTKYGWDTNRRTKPAMEALGQALLREGSHGIKDPLLAGELVTYVQDEKNPSKHEPAPGSFSDLLMAWLQAHMIRHLKPVIARRAPDAPRPNSSVRRLRY
jgi:hypothetical protein